MTRTMRLRSMLITLLFWTLVTIPAANADNPGQDGRVFVQLFEWRWDDVALECERVLGPAGIAAVQVSPANEHIDHQALPAPYTGAWWARYQPVSFQLNSRSGSEDEFRSMVERCAQAGVAVYADIVINHMANQGERGIAGTAFDRSARRYRDFDDTHFHPPCVIDQEDYWLRGQPSSAVVAERARRVRACQLGELPDLATERDDVRRVLSTYINAVVASGVTGLRIDAAKHMWPEDIAAILAGVSPDTFVFQEVIDTRGQSVSVDDYLNNGAVTEFLYSLRIGQAFAEGRLGELKNLSAVGGLLPSQNAVVFVDNHDNQRGHGMAASTTHRDGQRYQLATSFMLAWPYGYPRLMSSYAWGGVDDSRGPPADDRGNTLPVYRADGSSDCGEGRWVCEHRTAETLRLVDFRRRVWSAGASQVSNWWDNGGSAIAFSLHAQGKPFAQAAFNAGDEPQVVQIPTALSEGEYCALGEQGESCTRGLVKAGRMQVTLEPMSSLIFEQQTGM